MHNVAALIIRTGFFGALRRMFANKNPPPPQQKKEKNGLRNSESPYLKTPKRVLGFLLEGVRLWGLPTSQVETMGP